MPDLTSITAPATPVLARIQTLILPWHIGPRRDAPWPAYTGALIGLIALVQGLITLFQRGQPSKEVIDIEKPGQTPDRQSLRQRLSWETFIAPRKILLGAAVLAFFYTELYQEMGTVVYSLGVFSALDAVYIAGGGCPHLGSMAYCGFVVLVGAWNAEPGKWAPWPAISGGLIGLIALWEGLIVLIMSFSKPARSGKISFGFFTSGLYPMIDGIRNFLLGLFVVALYCTGHYKEMGTVICGLNLSPFVDLMVAGKALAHNDELPYLDLRRGVVNLLIAVVAAALVFQWTWNPFES
ncbi:hypothetical protein MBLNU457_g0873t1 [Dothideomycetes sp. NU457]